LTAAKGVRRLIHELDALSINRDGAKLLRNDHLEHLSGLVRGAVKCRGAEQRDPVVHVEMVHERIDPARRIWAAGGAVFRPQNEVEALLRPGEAIPPDHACCRSGKGVRGESQRFHGLGFGYVGAALPEPLVEVAVEGLLHPPRYS